MKLPSWNGVPVYESSNDVMSEATTEAWDVLSNAMGVHQISDLSRDELVHAVEAAAWLERVSEAGRHLLVPAAKASGASWAELGRAMGVPRATAQSRHEQDVADWEDVIRYAAGRKTWRDVEPLTRTEPPADFHPTDDQFVRHPKMPTWSYTGPLAPAIQYLCAHHDEVRAYADGDAYVVSSTTGRGGTSTRDDSEEEAWRTHLGGALARHDVWPDAAEPGETLADVAARTARD